MSTNTCLRLRRSTRFILGSVACMLVPGVVAANAQDLPPDAIHEAVRDIGRALTEGALDAIGVEPPPPREIHVEIETRPAETAVWIPGYWRWNPVANDYEWLDGVWREPPPAMEWHPGEWRPTDSGWVWVRGYWAPADRSTLISTPQAPPPLREEPQPPRPGETFTWVPGHWSFDENGFIWVSGEWREVPEPGFVWVAGEWMRKPDGYVFLPGYWDRKSDARIYDGLPPGHGGIPPGHGGTPPGQAKKSDPGKGPKGVPPGHRKDKPGK